MVENGTIKGRSWSKMGLLDPAEPKKPVKRPYRGRFSLLPKIHISMDSWWWHFLEQYVYALPAPTPRRRREPMQVICVGLPRMGTESLQQALLELGYDYTYHGWDIIYDSKCYSPGWTALARKKWYGGDTSAGADNRITAAEFDALLGHSVAVTDVAASVFAADMIAAYPEAKVILNMRRDVDKWHKSLINTLVASNENWPYWIGSWFDRECFWAWHVYSRFMWPILFRAPDGMTDKAMRRNAKWINEEHSNMIRGLVPKERLLEWYIEDGWEPLCAFLGKEIPDQEFPQANATGGGWQARAEQCSKVFLARAFTRIFWLLVFILVVAYFAWRYL